MENLVIKNANIHNLKNINISIPKNKLIVVTGVSGCGKSSLVYDVIAKQGYNRYLNYVGLLEDFEEGSINDDIEGLDPVIAVRQNLIRQSNPRSFIATKTKIDRYIKLLFIMEGKSEFTPSMRYLSPNSPEGLCLECLGRGHKIITHIDKIIPSNDLTLYEICKNLKIPLLLQSLSKLTDYYKIDPHKQTIGNLSAKIKEQFLYGFDNPDLAYGKYWGVIPLVDGAFQKKALTGDYITKIQCPDCKGYKIGEEGRSITIKGKHIGQLYEMSILQLHHFLEQFIQEDSVSSYGIEITKYILDKLKQLIDVNIGYLSLSREIPTLSGGEIQKLFLVQQLSSNMDSMIYIFDEPLSQLHESEKVELIEKIKNLKDNDNTIIVVEHNQLMLEAADYVIEMGPGAGEKGGQVIFQGSYIDRSDRNILSKSNIEFTKKRTTSYDENNFISLTKVRTNNLKNVSVDIPLNQIVGVAGLSGSGKSSLIVGTLVPLLQQYFEDKKFRKDNEEIELEPFGEFYGFGKGFHHISDYVLVTQQPIGRNSRSNLLTYLDLWNDIRSIFASSQSESIGIDAFSFNSSGACSECKGLGLTEMRMGGIIVSDICSECGGKRYKKEILNYRLNGKNISDILCMSVSEGKDFFANNVKLHRIFEFVEKIGLGYLKFGQPLPQYSSGEAQRLKCVKQFINKKKTGTLYILDEPSIGLSNYDICKLQTLLLSLVEEGNTVLVIEHNTQILSNCDWIIELGPGHGDDGGTIIAEDHPELIKSNKHSIIGKYL